jgi:endonuclease YncB( thermonuclease family)
MGNNHSNKSIAPQPKIIDNTKSLILTNPNDVPEVIFKNKLISVYIFDVHDGDTVKFLALIDNTVIKLSLRLLGIDTPEIRNGAKLIEDEKKAGLMARDRLAELISFPKQKLTKIVIRDWDKFGGRVLGEIILDSGESAADVLIAEGYGKPYYGGTKTPWTKSELAAQPFNVSSN